MWHGKTIDVFDTTLLIVDRLHIRAELVIFQLDIQGDLPLLPPAQYYIGI